MHFSPQKMQCYFKSNTVVFERRLLLLVEASSKQTLLIRFKCLSMCERDVYIDTQSLWHLSSIDSSACNLCSSSSCTPSCLALLDRMILRTLSGPTVTRGFPALVASQGLKKVSHGDGASTCNNRGNYKHQ